MKLDKLNHLEGDEHGNCYHNINDVGKSRVFYK